MSDTLGLELQVYTSDVLTGLLIAKWVPCKSNVCSYLLSLVSRPVLVLYSHHSCFSLLRVGVGGMGLGNYLNILKTTYVEDIFTLTL